mmetsp:Transcript_2422/g.6552  ORF Transcript_2422/g.6552 Transcript_2422/m.6552 type:complete len:280 (-) Transcript_2422:34-873(-)
MVQSKERFIIHCSLPLLPSGGGCSSLRLFGIPPSLLLVESHLLSCAGGDGALVLGARSRGSAASATTSTTTSSTTASCAAASATTTTGGSAEATEGLTRSSGRGKVQSQAAAVDHGAVQLDGLKHVITVGERHVTEASERAVVLTGGEAHAAHLTNGAEELVQLALLNIPGHVAHEKGVAALGSLAGHVLATERLALAAGLQDLQPALSAGPQLAVQSDGSIQFLTGGEGHISSSRGAALLVQGQLAVGDGTAGDEELGDLGLGGGPGQTLHIHAERAR